MSQTLTKIAQQLKDRDKKVQLIYAFNGSGKTRLSREFKELVTPKIDDTEFEDQKEMSRIKILYYNAFTEDLFYWDNDLDKDTELKLKIQGNSFTRWILEDQGQDQKIIENFQKYANDKLTPKFSPDFTEVTFSLQRGTNEVSDHIKISKAEESHFIWSFFYILLQEVIDIFEGIESEDEETNLFDQLEYIFIDDPVTSLDENHLIELAVKLAALINDAPNSLNFIITTHSPLFYNVLYNELKLKSGYILSKFDDGTFDFEEKKGASNTAFSYHLHIKNLIEQALQQNNMERYHFILLRNLYEKTAAFLGYRGWGDLLDGIEGDKDAYRRRINKYSHSTLSNEEITKLTGPEKNTIKILLNHLTSKYGPWFKEGEQNG